MSINTLNPDEIEAVSGGWASVPGGFPVNTVVSNGWTTRTISRPFEFSYGNFDGFNGSYSGIYGVSVNRISFTVRN